MAKSETPSRRSGKKSGDGGGGKSGDPSNSELAQMILKLNAKIEDLTSHRDEPAPPTRSARGTASRDRDVPLQPDKPRTLQDRLRETLLRVPANVAELSEQLGEKQYTIQKQLEVLEKAGKVSPTVKGRGKTTARFVWRPEASVPAEDRRRLIAEILTERPFLTSDIAEMLGIDDDVLARDIIEIRRTEPVWWLNKGAGGRGRANVYYLHPERVLPPTAADDDVDGTKSVDMDGRIRHHDRE